MSSMTEERIGVAAGTVYEILKQNGAATESEIVAEAAGLDEPLAYQGLGWLAREGKVELREESEDRRTYVLLEQSGEME
ncbi:MAG: winged helix-turn-helix domain-containing protein [Planctomycetota bacterium]